MTTIRKTGVPARPCGRARPLGIATLALVLPLTACLQDPFNGAGPSASSSQQGVAQGTTKSTDQADTFKQFNDIPIPTEANLDLEQSLVLGTEDGWIGRLSIEVNYNMADMYAFYTREMPRFSWEQLTTVRARISTMTYRRGARVATITLQPRSTFGNIGNLGAGTIIDFTVAPANRSVIENSGVRRGS